MGRDRDGLSSNSAILAALLTEKEEVDLVPKRYRPDSINNLCTATGYVLV